jgi:hypothetical protein
MLIKITAGHFGRAGAWIHNIPSRKLGWGIKRFALIDGRQGFQGEMPLDEVGNVWSGSDNGGTLRKLPRNQLHYDTPGSRPGGRTFDQRLPKVWRVRSEHHRPVHRILQIHFRASTNNGGADPLRDVIRMFWTRWLVFAWAPFRLAPFTDGWGNIVNAMIEDSRSSTVTQTTSHPYSRDATLNLTLGIIWSRRLMNQARN